MTNLTDFIDLVTDVSCYDHHKGRDMVYSIEYVIRDWLGEGGYYRLEHPGYLWDIDDYLTPENNRFITWDQALYEFKEILLRQAEKDLHYLEHDLNDPYISFPEGFLEDCRTRLNQLKGVV